MCIRLTSSVCSGFAGILLKSTAPSEIVELLQCPNSDMFTDEVDAAYETWIEEQVLLISMP